MSLKDHYDATVAKHAVTQRIVRAQDDYIKQIERDNQELQRQAGQPGGGGGGGGPGASGPRVAELSHEVEALQQENQQLLSDNANLHSLLDGKSSELVEGSRDLRQRLVDAEEGLGRSQGLWLKEKEGMVELIEKNQERTDQLTKVLGQERQEHEKRIEREVQVRHEQHRLEMAHAGVSDESTLVVSLKTEIGQLKAVVEQREGAVSSLRQTTANELQRLQRIVEEREATARDEKAHLQSASNGSRKMLEERDVVIAEERQIFERELEDAQGAGRRREAILREQIASLQRQLSELSGSVLDRQSVGEEKESRYEKRMRAILRMREEGEARLIAEKQQLLTDFERLEQVRSKHDSICLADTSARQREQAALIEAWESRETRLMDEVMGGKQQIERLTDAARKREEVMRGEIEAMKVSHVRLSQLAEERERTMAQENEEMSAELTRLQRAYEEREQGFVTQQAEHDQAIEDLRQLVRTTQDKAGAEPRVQQLTRETHALQTEVAQLRAVAVQRQLDMTTAVQTEQKEVYRLRTALAEANDNIGKVEAANEEYHARLNGELEALRNHVATADDAHSRGEQIAAAEIARLQGEVGTLAARLEAQRNAFEASIVQSEAQLGERLRLYERESAALRDIVKQVQRSFSAHRRASEAERSRLVAEVSRLEAEKLEIMEVSEERQRVHEDQVAALEVQLTERREATESAEAEAADLRSRNNLDVEALRLPELWQVRQAAVQRAMARATSELEVLRKRLSENDSRQSSLLKPLQLEIISMRQTQDGHDEVLQEQNERNGTERRRMREEMEAMEERIMVVETGYVTKEESLDEELEVLKRIKDRATQRELERDHFIEEERAAFEAQRKALVDKTKALQESNEATAREFAMEKRRSQDTHEQQLMVTSETAEAQQEQAAREQSMLQRKIGEAAETIDRLKSELERCRSAKEQAEDATVGELREIRGELHHLRRVATEKQLALSNEKQALIDELDRVEQRAEVKHQEVTGVYQRQVDEQQRTLSQCDSVASDEVKTLRAELGKLRRLSEQRAKQHLVDLSAKDKGLEILRQMEGARERQWQEEKKSSQSLVHGLKHHVEEVERIAADERAGLQQELDNIRREAAERERKLINQMQVRRRRRGEGSAGGGGGGRYVLFVVRAVSLAKHAWPASCLRCPDLHQTLTSNTHYCTSYPLSIRTCLPPPRHSRLYHDETLSHSGSTRQRRGRRVSR